MIIEFVDLKKQYFAHKKEIDAQIQDVLATASFIMGSKVEELEHRLAEFVGVSYAIGCASGTDALLLALMAYDLQPGDEVITTPFTFISTAEVIAFLKAKPVFVDIDEKTFNIDCARIQAAITKKTRGIIAVDLFGQCADYDEINALAQRNNLFVIEDAAQSFGAEYKGRMACSLTEVACTSFFPAKPFGCYGDGGMVFTNNENLAKIMDSLRCHGKGSDKYDNVRIGINARIDTLQAAILLGKFPYFKKEIEIRNAIARHYTQGLKSFVSTPVVYGYNLSTFAQYSICLKERVQLQNYLKKEHIPSAVYYPKPLHIQEAFRYLGYKIGDLPVSEQIAQRILALPLHPYLSLAEQNFIIERINSFFNHIVK